MPQSEPARPAEASGEGLDARRAGIAIAAGIGQILLTALAIRTTEMVTGNYISPGAPPLPAFAAVLVLSLLRAPLRLYLPRLAPNRAQILLIYVMLTVSTVLSGQYDIRAFLPHLVALQYLGKDGGPFVGLSRYLPDWYAPRDQQAILDFYNGARSGEVPWQIWIGPLCWWSLFFVALFLGVFCMVSLVQRQWIREEKLSFPLLTLPLALSGDEKMGEDSARRRRFLFLAGFGVAAVFNGLNILHVLHPAVPGIGFQTSLVEFFPNRPWTPLQHATIYYMLESIGIGYFVPLEVSFSIWFFYLLNRLFAVAGTAAGYDEPGFPFTQEQSAGSVVAVGLLLLWRLRASLIGSLRRAFIERMKEPEARSERRAWLGLIGSALFLLSFWRAAGFSLLLAVPYLAVLGLFTLVYARIRAETGVPLVFVYPYGLPKEMLLQVLSLPRALNWGGERSLVLFSSLAWLSRHPFSMEQAAYQIDSLKVAEQARIQRRTLFIALLLAFGVGLLASCWVHLSAYYKMGVNMAGGGTGSGEYRSVVARQEYQQMASRLANPPLPSFPRRMGLAGGFAFAALLVVLRQRWIGSPFHPLGFIIATAYGDHTTAWFPMLVAWLCKALILRVGGLRLYRRGIPFFLGLAIGHLFLAGVLWPILAQFIAREASQSYHLLFGG